MVSHPLSMRTALGSIPSASMRSAVRRVRIPTSGPCGGADNPQLWLAGTRQYPHHRTLRCAAGGAGRLERVRASCAGVALASQPLRRAARHGYVADHNMSCTWTHWDLNPGPSACEADVIPLHHVPLGVSGVFAAPRIQCRKLWGKDAEGSQRIVTDTEMLFALLES